MKKLVFAVIILSLISQSSVLAFDADKFAGVLQSFDKVAVPLSAEMSKGKGQRACPKGQSDDFVWLKADELNRQLEVLIQGIETAKQVSVALAIIVNLYQSDKISVEAALTAVRILKLRAIFIKVFVSNGNAELEIMINILQDHEDELGRKVQAKSIADAQINGRINNPSGY